MNLVKSESEALKSLTDIERYYVNLKLEPIISNIKSEREIKMACIDIITKASVDASPNGQPDSKVITFQASKLYDEITGKFKSLTLSEVKEAFRLGIRGESGPYFGLCPKTYHQFLKWWFDKTERVKAFDKYVNKANTFEIKEKPVESKQFFFEACERAYAKYKERKLMPEVPFCLYDFLVEYTGQKTLILKEDWPNILNEANGLYLKKIKHSALREMAKEWKMEARPGHKDYNNVYANSIKEVATRYFFERLIKFGNDRII